MRRRSLVLDAWVAVLTFVLCCPLLTRRGYPLARDLVFTPHQPMTRETLGLGSLPPRAVPLDALVWLAEQVVDGAVLAHLVVPGALLVAGWGAHRLARELSLPARFLVAGFAVWNPYVVERLALGQWALLWCYAALWWLVAALRSRRFGPGVGWLAVASITPTGGVIAAGTTLLLGRSRRLALVALLLQLPWLLPSLLGTAASTSDPGGVASFAARSERPGGAVLSLLGLGGIWDAGSTPGSRTALLGYATTVVVTVAVALGARAVARRHGAGLVLVGVIGLVLAAASSVAGLDEGVRWAVEHVPGAGLVRDAQKWLLPFVVLAVLSAGEVAHRLLRRAGSLVVPSAMLAALLPLLLLPDAAKVTWETVTPVHYPPDFAAVKAAIGKGDVAVLPWRSYRRFTWGRALSVYDPASRWFDNTVVTSDALQIGAAQLEGESARSREVGRLLDERGPSALGEAGVSWVLVYRDDPAYGDMHLGGLSPTYEGKYLALYRVPGPVHASPSTSAVLVAAVDLALLVAVLGFVAAGFRSRDRSDRSVTLSGKGEGVQ